MTQWNLPPLQTLSLNMIDDLAWLSLLTAVGNTLTSLRLRHGEPITSHHPQITLPTLKCLDIRCWDKAVWPLDLKTPVLETYVEHVHRLSDKSRYHGDTRSVRKMSSNRVPTLSSFPLLDFLQLMHESHVSVVFAKLASNESLCPDLQEVDLATGENKLSEPLSEKLSEVNRQRRVPVKLVYGDSSGKELPYEIDDFPVCPI
jgi:hypothetical protein